MKFLLFVVFVALFGQAFAGFYPKNSGVVNLNSKNFDQLVFKGDAVWIVEFYAPWCGHCQKLKPEYIQAARQLKGLVKLGAVNCDEEPNRPLASRYGIKGFPTLKIFPGKDKPQDYNSERSASAIVSFMKSSIPTHVRRVTAEKLQKFKKKNAELPHALLFTNKRSTTPLYKAISFKFRDSMVFGEVRNSEKALLTQFDVDTFPSLLVLLPGEDKPRVFEGKLTQKTLNRFLKQFIGGAEEEDEDDILPQLHDESCMKLHCGARNGLCVLLVTTVEGVKKHGDVLLQVRDARGDDLFHFAWVDQLQQTAFFSHFDITPEDYPQLVVVSRSKKRFARLLGSFNVDALDDFLKGVLAGRQRTVALQGDFPKLEGDTEKCKVKKVEKPKPTKKEKEPKKAKKDDHTSQFVFPITKDSFKAVEKAKSPWMLLFFAPWCGHCKAMMPEWKKAARKANHIVHFATVDCDAEKELAAKHGIKGFPTVKLFHGDGSVTDYQGPRTAKALLSSAFGMLKDEFIHPVTQTFNALRPELKRVVLFTKKEKAPKLFQALSMEFRNEAVFGIVHEGQTDVLNQFKIKPEDLPKIAFLDVPNSANQGQAKVAVYNGQLSFFAIAAQVTMFLGGREKDGSPPAQEEEAPIPEGKVAVVRALNNQKDFEKLCAEKAGLCVVTFLSPDAMRSAGEPHFEDMLDELSQQLAARPLHFLKTDRFRQRRFFNVFGVSDDGPASIVVMNPRRKRFAGFVGALTKETVAEFLKGVMSGRVRTGKFDSLPELETLEGEERLDDGVEEEEEEEKPADEGEAELHDEEEEEEATPPKKDEL